MSLLAWRLAEREDRDALRGFECTPKARNLRGFAGWRRNGVEHELRAQSMIRHEVKPKGTPRQTVLLGMSANPRHLGAVSVYRAIETAGFQICVIAVALCHRKQGGGPYGAETLSTTLDYITSDADANGLGQVTVQASIHEKNRPCQRLFGAHDFDATDEEPEGYQVWSSEILIGDDLFTF